MGKQKKTREADLEGIIMNLLRGKISKLSKTQTKKDWNCTVENPVEKYIKESRQIYKKIFKVNIDTFSTKGRNP